ncbi:MAG: methyltransferase domain-containing protein [Prevotellaceae bacterium]|jgi:SAM-dependent methyltransferase|nr:methyltransferase domain-containing protein [Prevotellaceae bacterium]
MKLKYLKELLGYRQNYSCNDYSCSLHVDNDENTEDVHIPYSKYNIPFDFVEINKGSIVVNIISNLGYEILKASEKTGANGKVIGIDFSPAMMYKARYNVEKNGCRNVFFREVFSSKFLPLGASISDALIFNNLLNRFPNDNLFSEIYRTLKPGGVFYIYDIATECLNHLKTGINSKADYIRQLSAYGFKNIIIKEFVKDISDNNSGVKNLNTALIRGEK